MDFVALKSLCKYFQGFKCWMFCKFYIFIGRQGKTWFFM